jgi:hypothetical protein
MPLAGKRVVFGGGRGGGVHLQNFVKLRQLYAGLDHAGAASQPQIAAGTLEAGEAAHDRADRGAVNVGDVGQIEDHECFLGVDERLRLLLDAAAIRTRVYAASHLNDGDALLGSAFHEVENHDFLTPKKKFAEPGQSFKKSAPAALLRGDLRREILG